MGPKTILLLVTMMLIAFNGSGQTAKVSKKGEPLTANNKGIALSQIDRVILRPTVTGTAYGATTKVVVYLLLKDGSIYSRPSASPHDLDLKKSKVSQVNKWGKWSKKGNKKLAVNFKSDQEWTSYYETIKGKSGERLQGSFKTVGGFRDTKVGAFNTLKLNRDGTFTWRYFYRTKGKIQPHSKDKKTNGKYTIKDYTIEFNYDSGQVERFLFAKPVNGKGVIIGSYSFYEFDHPLLN